MPDQIQLGDLLRLGLYAQTTPISVRFDDRFGDRNVPVHAIEIRRGEIILVAETEGQICSICGVSIPEGQGRIVKDGDEHHYELETVCAKCYDECADEPEPAGQGEEQPGASEPKPSYSDPAEELF